jgi:hypothetical protein
MYCVFKKWHINFSNSRRRRYVITHNHSSRATVIYLVFLTCVCT